MVDEVEKITTQEFLNTEEVKKKISEKLLQDWERYRKSMSLMALDAPISILNLPKSLEKALNSHGIHRLFELSCTNFTEIEGLSDVAVDRLTTSFNEFLAIC